MYHEPSRSGPHHLHLHHKLTRTMALALGPIIYTAVKPIIKIYLLIASGYLLGRRNVLTVETSRNISDILLTLILPCLMFTKIVTYLQNSDIRQIGIICFTYVLCVAAGGLGGLVCYAIGKPKYWFGGSLCVALMPNMSDLPIAYLQSFAQGTVFSEDEGEKGVAYICIFLTFQVIMQFNLGMFKLIGWDISVQKRQQENNLNSLEKQVSTDGSEQSSQLPDTQPTALQSTNSDDQQSLSSEDQDDVYEDRIMPLTQDNTSNIERTQSRVSNLSLRRNRSQTMNELVREYSQAASMGDGLRVVPSVLTELEVVPTHTSSASEKKKSIGSYFKSFMLFTWDNCKRPMSIALIVSITVAMVPWLKALFVTSNQVTLPNAPDSNPPLSFIIDYCSYIGAAYVPFGLLVLGATFSRLQINEVNFKVLLGPLLLSILRLMIMPIIGCAVIAGIARLDFFKGDDILRFTCTLIWGLPQATSMIFMTAFYTPLEGEWKQMDLLALTFIISYPVMSISLPFLTTYVIKCGLYY